MNLYNSRTWKNDLDEVIRHSDAFRALEGKTILITGATGLICSAIVDLLIAHNEAFGNDINIIAAGRSMEKAKERFAPYFGREYFRFAFYDATSSVFAISTDCDFIIHGASNASPDRIVKEPVETMVSNFDGLRKLLEFAKNKSAQRVLYISSSEVYGMKEGDEPYKEDEYGYIDLLNARNSYSTGKRAAETLCASYDQEYGIDTVIVRPGHIYGPTASPSDRRVSSVWPYSASKNEKIVMKSDGAQIRSYCYCLDCASAILTVLIKGERGRAYNISNPDSIISIREMAEILVSSTGVDFEMIVPTEQEKKGFNPMKNSSLDSTSLENLGWKGLFDPQKGFSHTVTIIRESV